MTTISPFLSQWVSLFQFSSLLLLGLSLFQSLLIFTFTKIFKGKEKQGKAKKETDCIIQHVYVWERENQAFRCSGEWWYEFSLERKKGGSDGVVFLCSEIERDVNGYCDSSQLKGGLTCASVFASSSLIHGDGKGLNASSEDSNTKREGFW